MRRVLLSVMVAAGLLGASFATAARTSQQPQAATATGAISGVVVDAQTDAPIAGAVVELGGLPIGVGQSNPRQLADDKGRFVFTGLAALPGGYTISATKMGVGAGRYGRRAAQRIVLREGEWFSDARVEIHRPASISGTVLDEHGDPIVGAYVRALRQVTIGGVTHFADGPLGTTDDRGEYRLMRLPPGKYVVSVPSVQVSANAASMAPTTTSPSGRPEASTPEPLAEIDATTRVILGRYPMPGPSADGRPQVYAPAFYPGTSLIGDAVPIEVGAGSEHPRVDLQLRPVPAVRVEGVLVGPAESMDGFTVRLLAPGMEHAGNGAETATTLSGPGGVFAFPAVPSGRYTVDVRRTFSSLSMAGAGQPPPPPPPPGLWYSSASPFATAGPEGLVVRYDITPGDRPPYWGRAPLIVDREDVVNVSVPMKRGVAISGRVVYESAAPGGAPRLLLVGAEPADGEVTNGSPRGLFAQRDDPSAFLVQGLLPGKYFLRFPGQIKSIAWNGRDMTHVPFDATEGRDFTDVIVTFTDKRTELSGLVHDLRGQIARDAVVIAFPVERDQWTDYGLAPLRLQQTAASSAGTFRYQNLPAGEYFVAAVDPDRSEDWRDAKFLEAASALATRVTLAWGDTKTVDVTVVEVKGR